MPKPTVEPLIDRILYNARLSNGTMPICIIVEDDAEKARAVAFAKGRKNCARLSFQTRAERQEIAAGGRRWYAQGGTP